MPAVLMAYMSWALKYGCSGAGGSKLQHVLNGMSIRAVPCCAKMCHAVPKHAMPNHAVPAVPCHALPNSALPPCLGTSSQVPGPWHSSAEAHNPAEASTQSSQHWSKSGIVRRKCGVCACKLRRGACTKGCSAHCGDRWVTPRLADTSLLDYV